MNRKQLSQIVDRLIEEGRLNLKTEFDAGRIGMTYIGNRPRGVDLTSFAKFQAGCLNLVRILGDAGNIWAESFSRKNNEPANVKRMIGTLQAIKESIDNDLLMKVEDLIRADSFNSLLEQAEYLLDCGYFLAAGVLSRAVLEEHLRGLCDAKKCFPEKVRPTLNDFKDALYRNKHINITQLKHLEAMAAIGNDAAHNKPELTKEDTIRLNRDVRDFISKNSVML